jgi:predicted Zn-dependent protease
MLRAFVRSPTQGGQILCVILSCLLAGCGSPEQRSQDYYQRGMALVAKKDDLNARLEFLNSVKYKSDNIEAWRALAGVEERTKAYQSLFQYLRRIVELDPKDNDARIKLAKMMLAGGAAEAALKLIDAGGEGIKSRADFHAIRAAILMRTNDAVSAVREAEQATSIEPGNLDAAIVLASASLSRGDADSAMRFLNAAKTESQDDPRVSLLKIQAFERKGNLKQAEDLLQKMISSQPQQVGLRGRLIQMYVAERRFDEAEKEIRAISSASPTDSKAGLDVVRFLMTVKGPSAAKTELLARMKSGGDVFPYQLALAELDFTQGNIADSVSLLESLIKAASSPEHILAAQIKLAEAQISGKNFPAAEPLIADILRKDGRNTDGLRLRAAIRIEQGQLDSAISDLREALSNQPKSPELLLLMATAYERNQKPELADRQYADALKASGLSPAVGLRYAAYLQRTGNLDQADKILSDVLNGNPQNVQIATTLAQVRLLRQNWDGALAVAEVIRGIGNDKGVADQIKGAALAGQNKMDASIAALENAHAAAPDAILPVIALVGAYNRVGKADKAEFLLQDTLKKTPTNAQLLVLLGQLQSNKGKPQDAIKSFQAAITSQPKSEIGYSALTTFYANQKNYDEAAKVIQSGLLQLPRSLSFKLTAASLLISKGDPEAAMAQYEAIVNDQPNSGVALNNLASLLLDYRTDKASIERAYTLADKLRKSGVSEFEDTLGWAQYRRGNYSEAISLLEDVIKKTPNLAIARYHLGMSYVAVGQTAQAAAQFKAALGLEPDGSELKEKVRAAMK